VPVLNGAGTIALCVESILGIDFARTDYELIVVDNGSTDTTRCELAAFGSAIRVVEEARRSPGAARNAGIAVARGQLIAFTDADCVVDSPWLKEVIAPLDDRSIGVAGGAILARQSTDRIARFGELVHDHRRAMEQSNPPYAITMNWASPRAVLDEVGLFDPTLARGEDVELSWRIHAAGYRFAYRDGARVRHFNESTLAGLFSEGFSHGRAAVAVRARFSGSEAYGRYRARGTFRRMLQRANELVRGPERFEALCWTVFELGKGLGSLTFANAEPRQKLRPVPGRPRASIGGRHVTD
jgi:glycosyltransferase involved in cell wall biosynthesis